MFTECVTKRSEAEVHPQARARRLGAPIARRAGAAVAAAAAFAVVVSAAPDAFAQYYPREQPPPRIQYPPRPPVPRDPYYPPRDPYYQPAPRPYYEPREVYREQDERLREPYRQPYREPARTAPEPEPYREPSRQPARTAPDAYREPAREPQQPREYPAPRQEYRRDYETQPSRREEPRERGYGEYRTFDDHEPAKEAPVDEASFGSGIGGTDGDQPQRLARALDEYRRIESDGGWPTVAAGKGMSRGGSYDCTQIAALEKRLQLEGYLADGYSTSHAEKAGATCRYSNEVSEAVKKFQTDRGIKGDGQLGPATAAELNRPVGDTIALIERALQRWQELPLDPSREYIAVNIPFFELSVVNDGREELKMPVIVGLPTWKTPLFSDNLEHIVINPEWGIPESIASQEVWPKQKRDKSYFRREGIYQTKDGHLRQKAGAQNPLGRLKFMMPNRHNVYLHDTPGKKHFASASRALSHGCVRVSRPNDLAEYLLRDDPRWTPQRIKSAIAGGKTIHVNLPEKVPVHILYATARINDDGRLEVRKDVYKQDDRVLLAREDFTRENNQDAIAEEDAADTIGGTGTNATPINGSAGGSDPFRRPVESRVKGGDELAAPTWPWSDQPPGQQSAR